MYRAFCRLLFEDSVAGVQERSPSQWLPPQKKALLNLPYTKHFRPSTLLGFLLACAPAQCPLPVNGLLFPAKKDKERLPEAVDLYLERLLDLEALSTSSALTSTSTMLTVSARQLYVSDRSAWKTVPNEIESWERIQLCLDTFFQRIAVADGEEHKQNMRLWYESIMDIGSHFFG
jgi:hypothetical protein